jgi:polyphosphate kinase 2 (PPK2 family)
MNQTRKKQADSQFTLAGYETWDKQDYGNGNNKPRKLKTRKYIKELRRPQAELCKLQDWVKHKGCA